MRVEAAWVKPPPQIGGLDHLAVQAPCINIYSRLLPGITNVTDRARYYSFYPWLIWALDQAGHNQFNDEFIERFRRADCLFSLIATRHAATAGENFEDHAAAIVGSNTLSPVASSLEKDGKVTLSDYSLRDGAKQRYFLNRLGGLGQYYIGVFAELSILDGDSSRGIKYTRQIGEQIAKSVDHSVNRDLFLSVVDADVVTASELEALSSFCPCQLSKNDKEQSVLVDLFSAQGLFADPDALPRRQSLQSILGLTELLDNEGEQISESAFRACAYTGFLPSGLTWEVPPNLKSNRINWAIYARNEILSIAVQGLFYAVLDAYEASGLRLDSAAQVVDWYLSEPETIAALSELGVHNSYSDYLGSAAAWVPDLQNWRAPLHEMSLMERVAELTRASKSADGRREIVSAGLRIFLALGHRDVDLPSPYADLIFDRGYFLHYPANLKTFEHHTSKTWAQMSMRDVLRWLLVEWGIELHLRVALRKLRGQSRSTFRIRPSDQGLTIIAVPSAAHTRPRFNQALRVLKDIGALERSGADRWRPSKWGYSIMELGDAP
ncbi:hypothetical protein HAD_13069 [Hyphomonas adhaerens MHS-3]|uniref:Uncharacterized protein n=1 Tax=Hyphomonas adhaerens MHS-3 TaxID=1280949 RepID=A0A069E1S6_9PROT|nr:hypothetical protein [Hyphomonas adhaerens]KCZ83534.1 hypothetical protein HAD_13069 [Hyphomonas adhaerens MHS-3]